MKTLSTLVVTVALILGLVGCGPAPTSTQYNLTVSSTEGGQVTTPGGGTYTYDEGDVVNLAAKPDEGYQFVNWTGDIGEIADIEDATTTITMKDDYSIIANFAVKQYSLITRSTEGGSVTTPGENTYTYDKGEVVNLVAVADEGYQFINWTGDVSTVADVNAASTTITMNGGYLITANFAGAIRDWYDLDGVRDNLDGSYVLMNDLDSSTPGYAELASPTANGGKGWQPIGSLFSDSSRFWWLYPVAPFIGGLDGQGYETRDLFINRPDEDGVGLFGCVEVGVVKNLGVVDAEVIGRVDVGSLVGGIGRNGGTVSNSYSSGTVTGDHWVGGLVGGSWGTVSNSYYDGDVTGDHWVGGLVGGTQGTVSDSFASGSVAGGDVGGLAGGNWGSLSNSYATGSVTSNGYYVGGLVGWNEGTVRNSYATGSITGGTSVGGLVGGTWGTVSNSYYSYDDVLINGRNIITKGALSSEDFEQWLANDRFLDVNESLSQEDGYYLINDVSDFKRLLAFGQNSSLKFRLMNDLDLATQPNFYIPYLASEFDGNGHKISNLNFGFDFISQVGLFGYLASGGVVTGVNIENVNITGNQHVGGLVGESEGTVSDSYSAGRVAGYSCVGGLVGWNKGTVSNSYYNHDEVLINGRHIITTGALFNEDFEQWLANDKFLDVDDRLSQEDGYYLINDVSDFQQLLAFGQDSSLKFRLKNDLNLATEPNFYIPYLASEFDGNGHEISNLMLRFDCVAQVGLFGFLASGSKVNEVGVENANISVTGDWQLGGLAGCNGGTVDSSYASGSVTGSGDVGGLVGKNIGTVSNSYATGSVTAYHYVGGLVGFNRGTVSKCYSTASVIRSYLFGGLTGWSWGPVSYSFWNVESSGRPTSDGGTGKTTTEMKSIATFSGAGWDIIAVANPSTRNRSYTWNIVDGQTYPFLSWQPAS